VVGDTSAQSPEIEDSLRSAGLGHLTAVSGANVAIVIAAFEIVLRRTRIRREIRLILLAFAVVAFVVIARPSPSVVRAAAMALFTLWVWFRGDQRYSEIILFSSCLALLIIDPWLAASWGFGLSVAATLGLIMLPRLWGVSNQSSLIVRAVATAVAAGLATLPLLIAMGSNPTLASLPANVFAEFLVAPATIAGVLTALLAAIESFPIIGGLIAPLTNLVAMVIADFGIWCARGIVFIAHTANQSIFNVVVTSTAGIVAIAFAVAGVFALRKYSTINTKTVAMLILICVMSLWSTQQFFRLTANWPPSQWQVVACDVGQGDATVIRLAGNAAIVVDVGGDADLLDSCLDDLSIEVVEIFIASHFHADHVGGVAGLSRGRIVNRVVVGALAVPSGGVELVKSALGREELEVATVGMSATYRGSGGDVSWTVLLADSQPSVDSSDGTAINNSSVVLLVQTPDFSVLLTGDIEIDAQSKLMKSSAFLGVDVVKVPHHGSKSQVPEFARWTGGRLAWISVGRDNDYGHPSAAAITYFKTAGMVILTTADCGDIALIHQRDVGFAPRDECHSV
jgi:competence protein ComEC